MDNVKSRLAIEIGQTKERQPAFRFWHINGETGAILPGDWQECSSIAREWRQGP